MLLILKRVAPASSQSFFLSLWDQIKGRGVCQAGVDFAEIILINTQICKLWLGVRSSTILEMPSPLLSYIKVL